MPVQQPAGISFHHIILVSCIIYVVLVGTSVVEIVLWRNAYAKSINILMLIPILVTTTLYYRHLVRGAFASPEIMVLVVLAGASILWSDFPRSTLVRSLPLIVTTAFAFALGSMMSLRQLMLFVSTVFAVAMVLALLAIITLPQARGIPPWGDTWNGIFLHKNQMGLASLLALVTSLYASIHFGGRLRAAFMFVSALSLFLLVASESRTSQLAALLILSAFAVSKIMVKKETIWAVGFILVVFFVIGTIAVLLSSSFAEPIFSLVGRRPTLSERLPLWELLLPDIKERFWLGYGYTAYWHKEAEHLRVILSKSNLGFLPHYSHNGLLETFLSTGFVGVSLLLCGLLRFFLSAFYCFRFVEYREVVVLVFVLAMTFLLTNITESTVLARANIFWIVFVAYSTSINLAAKSLRSNKKIPLAVNK